MEAGLMEIVRSLNINWIYDTYFSLYRAIHTWEKSGGNCTGGISGYPLQRRWTQTLILSMFSSLIPKQDVSATPFERHTFSRQYLCESLGVRQLHVAISKTPISSKH